MGVSKVVLNGNVLVDLTGVTVEATNLVSPNTAIGADGEDVTGSLQAKTSSDLTVSGATVTAPAGVYSTDASKSVASGSATTPATTITANPSISVSSGGLITATASATKSVTPTVSAGYVSSGTAGTITVSGSNTEQLSTQAAQTLYPSTTDQTISSGKYLTGTQTVKGVLLTNLSAGNIKKDVVVKVGDSADDDRIASITGTYEGSGGGDSSEISYYYGEGGYDVTANISSIPDIVFFHGWSSDESQIDNHASVLSGWATFSADGTIRDGGCNFLEYDGYNAGLYEMDPIGGFPAVGSVTGGISGGVLTLTPASPATFELTEYMIISIGAKVYGQNIAGLMSMANTLAVAGKNEATAGTFGIAAPLSAAGFCYILGFYAGKSAAYKLAYDGSAYTLTRLSKNGMQLGLNASNNIVLFTDTTRPRPYPEPNVYGGTLIAVTFDGFTEAQADAILGGINFGNTAYRNNAVAGEVGIDSSVSQDSSNHVWIVSNDSVAFNHINWQSGQMQTIFGANNAGNPSLLVSPGQNYDYSFSTDGVNDTAVYGGTIAIWETPSGA